jgi:hypothetical protein
MSCDHDSTRSGEMLMGADLEFESAVFRNFRLDNYTTTELDR